MQGQPPVSAARLNPFVEQEIIWLFQNIMEPFQLVSSCQVNLHLDACCQIEFGLFLIQLLCWFTYFHRSSLPGVQAVDVGTSGVLGHSYPSAARSIARSTLEIPSQGLTGGVWRLRRAPYLRLHLSFLGFHQLLLFVLSSSIGSSCWSCLTIQDVWICCLWSRLCAKQQYWFCIDSFLFFIAFISAGHYVLLSWRKATVAYSCVSLVCLPVCKWYLLRLVCFIPYFNRNLPPNHSWTEWPSKRVWPAQSYIGNVFLNVKQTPMCCAFIVLPT